MLSNIPLDIEVYSTMEFEELKNIYTECVFDNVIVDAYDIYDREVVEYIISKNANQKVIQLNENYICVNSKYCENCSKNFNVSILIKPYGKMQLARSLIQNFDCEQKQIDMDRFPISKVVKSVLIDFPFVKFDSCENKFLMKDIGHNLQISSLVEITDILAKNCIEYEVCEDSYVIKLI